MLPNWQKSWLLQSLLELKSKLIQTPDWILDSLDVYESIHTYICVCVYSLYSWMSVLINWSRISGRGCQCCSGLCKTSVWLRVKSLLWLCECLCLLGAGAQPCWTRRHGPAAAVRLQAWYRRNFPRSQSPALPAAFNKSSSASTSKLTQLILYLTSVLQIEIGEQGKSPYSGWAVLTKLVLHPHENRVHVSFGCVEFAHGLPRADQFLCQDHTRVFLTLFGSILYRPFHLFLLSLNIWSTETQTQQTLTSCWGFGRKKSFAGVDFQCKESFLLNSRFTLLKGLALGWFTY